MRIAYLYLFLGLMVACLVVFFAWIGLDATYFLPLAKEISQGHLPYIDFYCMYTPLAFIYWAGVYALVPAAGYKVFLAAQVAVIAVSAWLIYVNGEKLHSKKLTITSLSCGFLFLIAVLASDGHYLMLEPFVLVLLLASTWCMLKGSAGAALYSGVFIGLAFYAKQFGVAAFVPLAIYYAARKEYKQLAMAFTGMVGILLAGLFFFLSKGIDASSLFSQWWPKRYAAMDLSKHFGIATFILGGKVVWLLLVLLLFMDFKKMRTPFGLFCVSGFVILFLPSTVRHFPHYFLLCLPYLIFLIIYSVDFRKSIAKTVLQGVTLLTLFMIIYRYVANSTTYSTQVENAARVAAVIPHGSSAFITGETYLLVVNDYKNPLLRRMGYRWMKDNDRVKKILPSGTYLLPVKNNATDSVQLADGQILRWYLQP